MAASAPRAGDVLGHYRLLQQVGAGGMGVVFRARDEKLDREVAVKVIAPGLLADAAARRRWLAFAADRGLPNLPLFRDNPSMQKLRGSPEYSAFLRQVEPRWQALKAAL